MAAGTFGEIDFAAGDQILVRGWEWIWNVRSVAADRGVNGMLKKTGFKRGCGDIAADFGIAEAEIGEGGEREEQKGRESAEEEVFHESSVVWGLGIEKLDAGKGQRISQHRGHGEECERLAKAARGRQNFVEHAVKRGTIVPLSARFERWRAFT
jgi:hypothetical protein